MRMHRSCTGWRPDTTCSAIRGRRHVKDSGTGLRRRGAPGPKLAPDIAQALFDAEMDVLRWRTWRKNVSALSSLLHYGIQPEAILEKAIELEVRLHADRPGYIYPGTRGDERVGVRGEMIDAARVLQARALAQLGETDAAGALFEEIAVESPGSESLGEYGRHLLRTDRPEEALEKLVDALAYEGYGYRGAAEEAAAAAGLPADVVETRLAARRPVVQAEQDRRALGERLGRAAPDLVLADQNGVEWRLGDLTGKVVVLRFWATWCGHSLAELPHFAELVEKDDRDDDVVFLTVASGTSGRQGEGPGEYGGLRLLRGCPGAAITVFDWHLDRVTQLDVDGNVVDTRPLNAIGVNPYADPACSPDGDLIFAPWPEDYPRVAPGEHHRWKMTLIRARGDDKDTLLSGIPGTERTRLESGGRPRIWGRTMVFAVAPKGVWYGSAADYEIEHVDWTGQVTRIARWAGPDLTVTRERVDLFRDAWLARYEAAERRRRFEKESWPEIRDGLPDRFPAYEALLPLADGSVWVRTHGWRAPDTELHLLGPDGTWIRRLTMPSGPTLLDADRDWVLLRRRGELDEHIVAVYQLVESGAS